MKTRNPATAKASMMRSKRAEEEQEQHMVADAAEFTDKISEIEGSEQQPALPVIEITVNSSLLCLIVCLNAPGAANGTLPTGPGVILG